jgi:GntR family transcriptional repressor for pyruvate dehydrogenase complex
MGDPSGERSAPARAGLPPAALTGVRPAQRRRLTEEVVAQLLELIAAAEQEELALPVERELCVQLGVSRNVVREALSVLDGQGVVETRGKARVAFAGRARAQLVARVPGRALADGRMLEPIELRLIIEPEAAALAAQRATARDVRELERWLDGLAGGIERGESLVEYDLAFHVAIARSTQNDMLADLVRALADALRPSRTASFRPRGAPEAALADHRRIVDGIRGRDAPRAREAMAEHLRHVERLVRASLGER